jgi:hypothetical protein
MATNRTPRISRKRWNYPPDWDWDGEIGRPYSIEDWRAHRDQIMQYEAVFGRRPPEWWLYEHDREPPEHQGAALYEMGELSPDELEYRMEFWRKHFDLAMSPHFAIPIPISVGGDPRKGSTLITGFEAQRQHLEWAGIPHSLLTRWHAERRRAVARRGLGKGCGDDSAS